MKKIGVFLLPLAFFVLVAIFLLQGLFNDPRKRDSSLLQQSLPAFQLPDVMDEQRVYTEQDFVGKVSLINVWGVWCVTCAVELPYLTQLREQGVDIVGLYYEQEWDPDFGGKSREQIRAEVKQKLGQLGNPYQYNILDVERQYSFDLGVTGAPETFLIDKKGTIRLHHIGDINPRVWQQKFSTLYQQLEAE